MLANGKQRLTRPDSGPTTEPGPRPTSDIVRPDPRGKDSQRPCDILECFFPQIDKLGFDPPAHMVVRRTRDADASGLGDALEPRRDIDAIAEHVVPVDQHVAEMNADPVHDVVGPAVSALRSAICFCIVSAHSTAATTEGNSISIPSPIVLNSRPPCAAMIGAAASRRSRTAFAVPASSSPIMRE